MPPVLNLTEGYQPDLANFARTGLRVGIWAASGRGKSYGVGVLCEELLGLGIPLLAVDPEGELHTLRQAYRVLVLGGPNGDLPLGTGSGAIRQALDLAVHQGIGLVLDLVAEASVRRQQELVLPWLTEYWRLLSERKAPAALVLEEVHLFAPQGAGAVTAEVLARYAKQGRKRGAILVVASQRVQAVDKQFMSQLNFPAIGGFEVERDFEAVSAWLRGADFHTFRTLPPGVFYFPAAGGYHRWRPRLTPHGGETPDWESGAAPALPPRDSALQEAVEILAQAMAADREQERLEKADLALARERVRELEGALARAEAEVRDLRIALKVAGAVQVVVQPVVAPVPAAAPAAMLSPAAAGGAPAPALAPPTPAPAATVTPPPPAPRPALPLPLDADALLAHSAVKDLVRRARGRVSYRIKGGYSYYVPTAIRLMAGGGALTPGGLAERCGLRSSRAVKRMDVVLEALVGVGLARPDGVGYRLHLEKLQTLLLQTPAPTRGRR